MGAPAIIAWSLVVLSASVDAFFFGGSPDCPELEEPDCKGHCVNQFYIDNWVCSSQRICASWGPTSNSKHSHDHRLCWLQIGDGICDWGLSGHVDSPYFLLSGNQPFAVVQGIDFFCAKFDVRPLTTVVTWRGPRYDGGDCPEDAGVKDVVTQTQETYEQMQLPSPEALFSFTSGSAGDVDVKSTNGQYTAGINKANWVDDELLGTTVVECNKDQKSFISVDDIPYGYTNGGFTVNFWFRNPDSPGQLFEYMYSHGTDTDVDGIDNVWAPNNIHVYLPEEAHPAHGIIRTIVKDSNDPEDLFYYVDRCTSL
eukprot:scaffold364_cov401-Prasinococcus_capsulatus_cf.AAC.4